MRTTRSPMAIGGVAFALVALTLGACGDDDSTDAGAGDSAGTGNRSAVVVPEGVTGTDDPFCGLARDWAAHELIEPDYNDPAAFAEYWPEYVAFVEGSRATAPDEIADAYAVYAGVVTDMTDVFERYEFDGTRFEAEATPEEQEIIEPTDPELQAANHAVLAFEAEHCGTGQPLAADVSFSGELAGSYCDAVASVDVHNADVLESNFDPGLVEELVTSDDHAAAEQAVLDGAPEPIRSDVEAVVAWFEGPQRTVLEQYGFDFRRVLREASDDELADFNLMAPEIREQFARTLAYEEQVCGF